MIFVHNHTIVVQNYPGWGAIRKWPLIRPSPKHTVCSQTKITGSGIWFQRTVVWSEVTSVWGWYDQRSLRSGDGMIRGHFGLGMVWSEVTSVWGWYDQRSLRSGDGMIRGHFGLGMVWPEVTLVWGWYDQRTLRSGDGMIRGHFGLGMVWSEVTSRWEWSDQRRIQAQISLIRGHFERNFFWFFVFFKERCRLCQEATKSSILITDGSRVWCLWSETKGSNWLNMSVPSQGNFD